MLNKERSPEKKRLKLLFVLPVIGGMLCASTMAFTKDYGIDLYPKQQEALLKLQQDTTKKKANVTTIKNVRIKGKRVKPNAKDTALTSVRIENIKVKEPIKFPPPIVTKDKVKFPPPRPRKALKGAPVKFPPPIVTKDKDVPPPPPVEPKSVENKTIIEIPDPIVKVTKFEGKAIKKPGSKTKLTEVMIQAKKE